MTRGLSGPNPRLNGKRGRPAGPTPWPVGQVLSWFSPQLRGHVSTREEEGQGGASHSTRPAGRHLVSYCLGQVSGALP
jgi:hypothetical protein